MSRAFMETIGDRGGSGLQLERAAATRCGPGLQWSIAARFRMAGTRLFDRWRRRLSEAALLARRAALASWTTPLWQAHAAQRLNDTRFRVPRGARASGAHGLRYSLAAGTLIDSRLQPARAAQVSI